MLKDASIYKRDLACNYISNLNNTSEKTIETLNSLENEGTYEN